MVLFPLGCDRASLAQLGSDCKLQQPTPKPRHSFTPVKTGQWLTARVDELCGDFLSCPTPSILPTLQQEPPTLREDDARLCLTQPIIYSS